MERGEQLTHFFLRLAHGALGVLDPALLGDGHMDVR
jgi:hypothetical protein